MLFFFETSLSYSRNMGGGGCMPFVGTENNLENPSLLAFFQREDILSLLVDCCWAQQESDIPMLSQIFCFLRRILHTVSMPLFFLSSSFAFLLHGIWESSREGGGEREWWGCKVKQGVELQRGLLWSLRLTLHTQMSGSLHKPLKVVREP